MPGFQVSRGGNGPGGMTSISAGLSGTSGSVPVTLANPSNRVLISNYSEFPLYINFATAASPLNYAVPPNQTTIYDGPAINGFQLNSNGQVIKFGVLAV